MVPLVTASLPLDHDTTALGEASLTQWIATTILPSESTVVLTAGRNSTGLPGEDTVLLWSLAHIMQKCCFERHIVEHLKLTCSNIALILFNWVVCHARDSFPIEVICGGDSQAKVPRSTAGVA